MPGSLSLQSWPSARYPSPSLSPWLPGQPFASVSLGPPACAGQASLPSGIPSPSPSASLAGRAGQPLAVVAATAGQVSVASVAPSPSKSVDAALAPACASVPAEAPAPPAATPPAPPAPGRPPAPAVPPETVRVGVQCKGGRA